jgi:hypothetical protein
MGDLAMIVFSGIGSVEEGTGMIRELRGARCALDQIGAKCGPSAIRAGPASRSIFLKLPGANAVFDGLEFMNPRALSQDKSYVLYKI